MNIFYITYISNDLNSVILLIIQKMEVIYYLENIVFFKLRKAEKCYKSTEKAFKVRTYTSLLFFLFFNNLNRYFPSQTWFFLSTISPSYRLNNLRYLSSKCHSIIFLFNLFRSLNMILMMFMRFLFLIPIIRWHIFRYLLNNLFQRLNMLLFLFYINIRLIKLLSQLKHLIK